MLNGAELIITGILSVEMYKVQIFGWKDKKEFRDLNSVASEILCLKDWIHTYIPIGATLKHKYRSKTKQMRI